MLPNLKQLLLLIAWVKSVEWCNNGKGEFVLIGLCLVLVAELTNTKPIIKWNPRIKYKHFEFWSSVEVILVFNETLKRNSERIIRIGTTQLVGEIV